MRCRALPMSLIVAASLPAAAQTNDGADTAVLGDVVVTATRNAQSIRDVPAAVSVVSRDQIEKSSATTVDQLLQAVPGVYAARMDPSSPNRIAQTYTRGLPGNSRTLVLVDGLPMNVLYDGQVDWSQLVTSDVERVEVVRGATSGLYGANAMGGVINIISRAPQPGVHTDVGAAYGSMDTRRYSAAHSQSQGGTAFSVSGSHLQSDGYNMWRPDTTVPLAYRAPMGTVKDNVATKVVQDLSATDLLEAGASWMRDEATGFYKTNAGNYTPQTREQTLTSLRYAHGGERLSASAVLYGRFGKQWADTLNTTYTAVSEKGYYEDISAGLNAQGSIDLTDWNRLTAGLDYLDGGIDNHFTYPGTTRVRDTHGDVSRYGVFVQDELRPTERWRINFAGRYDHWKTGGNQTDTGAGQPNSAYAERTDHYFSPKAAALYKLTENLNLRASAGKAFNVPDMFNLYANTKRGTTTYWANPDLKPERVTSYDIGLDRYFGQRSYAKATWYRNEARDFIYSVQRDATNVDKTNVGAVRTHGWEFEFSYAAAAWLQLTAAYTLNDSDIVENDRNPALVGKQLMNVPNRQATLRADFSFGDDLSAFAAVNDVGRRYGNDVNTTVYKPYTTLDLGVTKSVGKQIVARLTVTNVADVTYDGVGYIAPGQVTMLSLNGRF